MTSASQYVTLGVAGDLFAAPVEQVQEILDLLPITRLPHAPPSLLGMIDVRGRGIPVFDLRLVLGLPRGEDDHGVRIVVLRAGADDGLVGLRADRVFEVAALDGDALEPAPGTGGRRRLDAVAGVGRRNGAFVIALDVERLVAMAGCAHAAAEA